MATRGSRRQQLCTPLHLDFNNLDFVNSGTSFAAPHVSGVAALIMNVNAAFEVRPEAVKAVIMASAVHNVIGDPRLSQHDGAGGINAEMAVKVAREQGGSGWEGLRYSCSAPAVTSLPLSFTANKQTRVVIAWGTDPNYFDYQNNRWGCADRTSRYGIYKA